MLFAIVIVECLLGAGAQYYPSFKYPAFEDSYRTTKVLDLKDKESGGYGDHVHGGGGNPPYKNSWKTLRSEKYETETIDNPYSEDPANRYIVKSKLKVREKLPFEDTTHGYDHEYEYPLSEYEADYQKNARVIDFESVKNDPFPADPAGVKGAAPEVKKKPELSYYYRYPENDHDYFRNVKLINNYLAKTKQSEPKKADYEYNDVDYAISKNLKGPSYDYGHEPYQHYKTDDYSLEYLDEYDYDKRKKRVPKSKLVN